MYDNTMPTGHNISEHTARSNKENVNTFHSLQECNVVSASFSPVIFRHDT